MDSNFLCILIGFKLGISLDIHCFGMGFKMASRFTTVSKDEILVVNEAAATKNTKKGKKFGLLAFTGGKKFSY